VSRDHYLDQIAEFFREPWVNFLLIMLGILGLILEVKLPGTTVPGCVSAICFVLFFLGVFVRRRIYDARRAAVSARSGDDRDRDFIVPGSRSSGSPELPW